MDKYGTRWEIAVDHRKHLLRLVNERGVADAPPVVVQLAFPPPTEIGLEQWQQYRTEVKYDPWIPQWGMPVEEQIRLFCKVFYLGHEEDSKGWVKFYPLEKEQGK